VMNHYTKGIQDSHTLDDSLKGGVALTSNEKVDIIAFLLTLSDKSFLFNKDLAFPQQ
jgi:cytochrome c peroxidase